MKSKKLTYAQLATMVRDGVQIPEEYRIKWRYGEGPHKDFEIVVSGDDVEYTRNPGPKPTSVKIISDYVPLIPMDASAFKSADFGNVTLDIRNEITLLEFTYDFSKSKLDGRDFMEWCRKYSEAVTGRQALYHELTMDLKVKLPMFDLEFFGVLPKSINFANFDCDCDKLIATLGFSHYVKNIK